MPSNTIDYYETAEKTLGGHAATQDFFRLFMVPITVHGGGGAAGTFAVDWLKYLEAWVEEGKAPDMVMGAHIKTDLPEDDIDYLNFPLPPARIVYTRPVYPYPVIAKYKGAGDPTKAENFSPVMP